MRTVLTIDTPTSVIKDIALSFRKSGITPDEFHENPEYYLGRLRRTYEIVPEDFDEVAFAVFCFMRYIQF